MKDDRDLDGVPCTELQYFSLVFLRLVNGTLNEYSIYNLMDVIFDSFSRP
jgi:hypothetical protein